MSITTSRRSVLLGAGAMGAALMLKPGAGLAQTAQRGGRFRIGMADFSTSDSLDPQLNETRFQMNLNWQLRNCLIEVGPGGVLVPELAESWDSNADLTEWTFKLRRGVEFHNGKTLTPEDVIYSINLHRGADTKSAVKPLVADITDIRKGGPDEVVVTLASANGGFASVMTVFPLLMVPDGETDFEKGVGTGGYILESFEPGVRSIVRRNPNYWKEGRAHFDEIEIIAIGDVSARTTALQTGAIDAMNFVDPATAALLQRMSGVSLVQTRGKVHYKFGMRTDMAPFDNNDVRLALKYAIDREEMLEKIVSGYGALGNDHPLSQAYEFFDPGLEQRVYDPERARHHLRKAGAEGLTVPLHASDTPFAGAVDAAQLYREHAAKAGITIDVVREPEDGYWANIWGKKPFFASRWSGRVNEDVMFSTPYAREALASGWNATKWDNDPFNVALRAARSERDQDRRRALYHECQALMRDEGGAVIPVFADFIDGRSDKVAHGDLSSDWDLDGARCGERWWFA